MCLDIVGKTLKGRSKTVKVGYKVFSGNAANPSFKFRSLNNRFLVPMSEWLTAHSIDLDGYLSGFHIFIKRADAAQYRQGVVLKVKYKGVLAIGRQEVFKTVVAKHMYVPKKRTK